MTTVSRPPKNEFTVLLVEDSSADARFVREVLPKSLYSLKHVSNLRDAREFILQCGVNVILLDLSLPDAHGLDTFGSIAAVAPDIPILVLTGLDDESISIEAVKLGAQDYILKREINEGNLARSIRYAVERKESEKAIRQSAMQAREAESFLKMALTASFTGVWSYDPSKERFVADAQVSEMLGLGDDGLRTTLTFMLSLVHSDDRIRVERAIDAALAGTSQYDIEHRIVRSDDKSVRYIAVKGKLCRDEETNTLFLTGIANDVTERKLREQEHYQLAAIVASSDDGIISKDLEGKILTWNLAAQRIYDYSAQEVLGENISKLVPESQKEELDDIIQRLKRGERIEQQETIRKRKDGTLIEVSLTVSPIHDTTGSIIAASTIVRDITRRKRTERFLACQNSVTRVLSETDTVADAAGQFLQPMAEMLGWDVAEIWCLDADGRQMKCVDIWHEPNTPATEFEALSRYIALPPGIGVPGLVWAESRPIWIDDIACEKKMPRGQAASKIGLQSAVGVPIIRGTRTLGAIAFYGRGTRSCDNEMIDILSGIAAQLSQFMDRKLSERAAHQARQAEERVARAILENAPIGIARLTSNLVVTEANQVFCKQFGAEKEKLVGSFIFQVLAGIPSESLLAVAQQGVPSSMSEILIKDRAPDDVYCDIAIWPMKDADDRPVGLVVLSIDVTERVKLSKQREDFVATLTHDLKNPLIGQDRLLDLLLANHLGPIAAEQTKALSLVKSSTRDMLDLIGTLLEVYRYEAGRLRLRLEPIDMPNLIENCIAQVAPVADASEIEISWISPPSLPVVFADPAALRRVMMNLLDNAAKFTPSGGAIEVSCIAADGNMLKVTVQDNGAGIATDELPGLFQRFSQSRSGRRQSAGTGLGLYLCRQIVEAHGGTIMCTSEEGRGSTFVFSVSLNLADDHGD